MKPSHEPGRMLVVDDNRVNRLLLTHALEQNGHLVSTAENGRIGLEKLKSQPFDVLLLDIDMPVMNGLDFLKRLRAEYGPEKPPVVFCTTETEMSAIELAIMNGAQEYIMKPFDKDILVGKFEQVGLL